MYYTTLKGKKETHKFQKGEYEQYTSVCNMIWGGFPLDVGWATNTNLYKEALKSFLTSKTITK